MHPSILFRFFRLVRCVPFYFAPFSLLACTSSLSRTQLVHARPSRTQSQPLEAVEGEEGSGEGTTRYAYKMYFVNKVNAITNKLDFVPCFLYFVAGPCIFGPGNGVGTEAASSHRWEIAQVRLGGAHEQGLHGVMRDDST